MKYKKLGKSSISVSEICLGTMTFGEQTGQKDAHEIMDYALEHGVTFYDTAEMYSVPGRAETQGSSERILGRWMKDGGHRSKVVVATKITGPSTGLSYIRNPLNFHPEQIQEAVEGSLQRLQTDYIDIYQLHWPERKTNTFGRRGFIYDPADPWEDNFLEVLEQMSQLIQQGKIRAFGVSNETPWGLMHFLKLSEVHGKSRPVSIQNPYNLLNRTFEIGLAEIAIRESVDLLAYSPLAFGLLSGKYHEGDPGPEARLNKFSVLSRYNSSQAREAAARYIDIAHRFGLTPAQLSLAFVNTRPFVGSNIIGVTSLEQLKENLSSTESVLNSDILEAIEEVHRVIPDPAP